MVVTVRAARCDELAEQCAGERRALDRVGAGGDLVEQHERPRRRRLEDVHEIAEVSREGRERRRDGLLVADVGQHVGEDRQTRALGRDVQAALVQQRAQPERLQRDRLAARVGSAEHEHPDAREREIDRHDGRRIEQRMAGGDELDVAGRLDRAAAPAARERSAGERDVDRGQHLDGVRKLVRVVADMPRELGQDPRHLVALVALELAQPVGELDDRERLDEQRLAGVARVVHDARHGAACARAHGHDRSPAALRHEIFLQMRLKIGIRRERPKAIAGAAPCGRELGAQRLQLRRGGVLDARGLELERALEPVGDGCERLGDLARSRCEQRHRLAALGQMTAHTERGASRLGDRDEPLGPERPAATRMLGLAAHVVRPRHPGRPLLDENQRLGAERLPRSDLAGVRRGQQSLGQRPAGREGRVVRKPLANRGELEHVERVTVHQAAG